MTPTYQVPGTRGFLLWTKRHLPWVYSEYARQGAANIVSPGLGAYDGDCSYDMGDISSDTTTFDPVDAFDTTTVMVNPPSASIASPDPATVAPAAPTTPAQADWFSQVAKAASQVILTKAQADTQNQVLNAQLRQAQLGLPMLDLSKLGLNLPTPLGVSGQANVSQSGLLWLAAIVGGLFLLTSKQKT